MKLIATPASPFCRKVRIVLAEKRERGGAGALYRSGATRPGGRIPVSTFGDAMSYGHIGAGIGLAAIVESVRQLNGQAGERQVPGADIVLKTSAGGAYADAQITIFGKEPR